jgi:hypothetical protein
LVTSYQAKVIPSHHEESGGVALKETRDGIVRPAAVFSQGLFILLEGKKEAFTIIRKS